MKFTTLFILIVLLLTGFSCGKRNGDPIPEPDTVPPVLTLNGPDTFFLAKGRMPKDPLGTAIDNIDGDVTTRITSNWDALLKNQTVGFHTVNYSVTDLSLLKTLAKRVVWIEYTAPFPTGNYSYLQIEHNLSSTPFDSVATTCIVTPTKQSDQFQVQFTMNGQIQTFQLEPKDSTLSVVTVRNLLEYTASGKFSTNHLNFDFSGLKSRNQGGYIFQRLIEGHMNKLP